MRRRTFFLKCVAGIYVISTPLLVFAGKPKFEVGNKVYYEAIHIKMVDDTLLLNQLGSHKKIHVDTKKLIFSKVKILCKIKKVIKDYYIVENLEPRKGLCDTYQLLEKSMEGCKNVN